MARRKVHIDGEVWSYFVSLQTVHIRNPEKKAVANIRTWDFLGIEADDYWCAYEDQSLPSVTPAAIKKYIIENLK